MSEVIEKPNTEDGKISVLDLLIVVARNKKILILMPLSAGIVAALCTLFIPNTYIGSVKLMPPQQSGSSSAAAMSNQLGGGALGGLSGGALGIKNPGDLYVGLLKSRTVSDRLIARFKLKERFEAKTTVAARMSLQKFTSVTAGKDGLITLDFEDVNPIFAANVANAYVEELDKLTQGLAVTDAGQRRLYFERQLSRAKDELAVAEGNLRNTQETTGLIDPSAQGKAIIESIAAIRAQVASREVALGAMKSFATGRNPDAIRIRSEIEELQSQLAKLEKPVSGAKIRGDTAIPSGNVPEVGLEYARKLREVKYHEVLFELMAKQYEMARADEARNSGTLQVVDKAVPSDEKSKPKRFIIVLASVVISFFCGVVLVYFRGVKRQLESTQDGRRRLFELSYLMRKF